MSTPAIRACILEAADIVEHLAPQVVFNLHAGQRGGQLEDLLVGELADGGGGVDVVAGHEAGADGGADAEEGLEGFLGGVLDGLCGCMVVVVVGLGEKSLRTLTSWRSVKLTPRMKTCKRH